MKETIREKLEKQVSGSKTLLLGWEKALLLFEEEKNYVKCHEIKIKIEFLKSVIVDLEKILN